MEQVHSMGNICTYVLLRWVGFLAVTPDGGLLACPEWTISATHANFLQSVAKVSLAGLAISFI